MHYYWILHTLIKLTVLLGFAYLINIFAAKEKGKAKQQGQLLAKVLVVLVVISLVGKIAHIGLGCSAGKTADGKYHMMMKK